MKTLLIIDGNAIMHRAFHALPPFKTKAGVPTNAVYGFFTMLYKALQDFRPQYIAVCFDTPAKTFRQELHKEYQAHRPEIADELKVQIPIIRDLLDKAKIYRAEKEGYEADDVIGTLTKKAKKTGVRVLILTGDKDILQLVDENTTVISPQLGLSTIKIYDENEVKKKLHVEPKKIPDWKALAGDPSDNYPGAEGIGPKTAVSLLEEYGTLENLFLKLETMKNDKLKAILIEHKDNVLLAKKLSQLVTNVDVPFTLEKAQFVGFGDELKSAFTKLEMSSLIQRFFNQPKKEGPTKKSGQEHQINLF